MTMKTALQLVMAFFGGGGLQMDQQNGITPWEWWKTEEENMLLLIYSSRILEWLYDLIMW